jgi:TolB protein
VLARFPAGIFPSSPAWSPDGDTIAYSRLRVGRDRTRSGVYAVNVDDGVVHRLTRDIDSNPSWSPDGRRIAFERLTGFHISEITVMDRDGSNQKSLTHGGWSDSAPAWRPAG